MTGRNVKQLCAFNTA